MTSPAALFSSLGSTEMPSTFYEKEDSFQRVFVRANSTRLYPLKSFIIHNVSNELYLDEPLFVTRIKCALIAFSAPVFAITRISWYLARVCIDIYVITQRHFRTCHLFSDRCCKDLRDLLHQRLVYDLSQALLSVAVMVLTLGFATAGVILPLQMRRQIARVEKVYMDGASQKDPFCLLNKMGGGSDLFDVIGQSDVMFHAPCFQCRGLLDPSRFLVLHKEKI
jgi:hypothetical protein